jgi:pantoate--beta-alanine ligase
MTARKMWLEGEKDAEKLRQAMVDLIRKMPLGNIEYVSIADALTLRELAKAEPPAVVSLAVKFGRTRLIDNMLLE